ncbi:MAG TPA: signal peptidase I [Acidimicrobiia bacterium]|nr:signal peptidase I [Acidimicrobiia bacterium]
MSEDVRRDEGSQPPAEPTKKKRSFWSELPGLLLTALVIAVLIKTFLVQPFWIPSESMLETIHVNDRVMVNKLAFQLGEPERGDVVVFRDPAEPEIDESIPEAIVRSVLEAVGVRTRGRDDLIKRVIGLPGETVTISDNTVHIDGVAISEPYLANDVVMPDDGPYLVGQDEVFVMGDNREFSFDSRRFGNIEYDALVGRAFVIIWPVSNFGGL